MTQQKGDRIEDMYICSIGKLNEESVSSGSEWEQISIRNNEYSIRNDEYSIRNDEYSIRNDEYNKGMNGMNSTKVKTSRVK